MPHFEATFHGLACQFTGVRSKTFELWKEAPVTEEEQIKPFYDILLKYMFKGNPEYSCNVWNKQIVNWTIWLKCYVDEWGLDFYFLACCSLKKHWPCIPWWKKRKRSSKFNGGIWDTEAFILLLQCCTLVNCTQIFENSEYWNTFGRSEPQWTV